MGGRRKPGALVGSKRMCTSLDIRTHIHPCLHKYRHVSKIAVGKNGERTRSCCFAVHQELGASARIKYETHISNTQVGE